MGSLVMIPLLTLPSRLLGNLLTILWMLWSTGLLLLWLRRCGSNLPNWLSGDRSSRTCWKLKQLRLLLAKWAISSQCPRSPQSEHAPG
ncbi:hypothetical protein MRB53_023111 [Persea americana]|uniref:Uncharacterized protein n=1 Tax=Persea americana TaxID=3435 RepID=A0ACC2L9R6_PERAE|nr:hypothetical protein MRB53_023111 [Persea americana]